MNNELLRLVDSIHRDKNIDTDIVFKGIESAYLAAAKKYFGEEEDIDVKIDRSNGEIIALHNGAPIDPEHLGRIPAQSAKQIMIQKIREAERDQLYDEFSAIRGQIVTGLVQRSDESVTIINVGKSEALLPRSEQMPGETYRAGERIRCIMLEARKAGHRVKVILSRTHPDFVRRLFEQEIPEIAEHIIEIRSIAREAGHRTKVAVSSIDSKVDCVGACVGVRGNRIKNVLDELGNERIDIIRYNESMQVMIPNALQPAQIEEVQIYHRIGRAIVLVKDDQLSLAIGKRGQNVRLASKLVGIDIEIMTFDELTEEIERAEQALTVLPNADEGVVDALIEEGLFSFDDVSVMEPDVVMEITGLEEEPALELIAAAEQKAEEVVLESSSRSSFLTGPPLASAAKSNEPTPEDEEAARARQILGMGDDEPATEEEHIPSAEELFRDAPAEEAPAEDAKDEPAS